MEDGLPSLLICRISVKRRFIKSQEEQRKIKATETRKLQEEEVRRSEEIERENLKEMEERLPNKSTEQEKVD